MTYNLFIEHHTNLQSQKGKSEIGNGWEDNFTNILSFYLSVDIEALNKLVQLILDDDYEIPVSIKNQVVTPQGRPDIVISLKSGSILIVECKVDATLQPDQLERYLEIRSNTGCQTFLSLFTKKPLNIPTVVLENAKYKSPLHGSHFFWTDLYSVLPKAGNNEIGIDNARWLFRNYMELIGFAPSSLKENWFRLYEERTIDENQKVQKEFGRKLSQIRSWLSGRNFKVTAVSHSGLQAVPKMGILKDAGIYFVVIGPEKTRKDLVSREIAEKLNNEVLRLALIYDSSEIPEQAWEIYKSFPVPLSDSHDHLWWPTTPYKFSKNRVRLEFVSNLSQFLNEETEIETRINDGCQYVIDYIISILKSGKSYNNVNLAELITI